MRIGTTRAVATAAAVAAGLALLAGCSSDSTDGTPAAQAQPTVDPATLDVGKYATAPQPEFGPAGSDGIGRAVEGQRMAEFITLPDEIDPSLTDNPGMSTYVIKNGKSIGTILPGDSGDILTRNNMIAGYSASRSVKGKPNQTRSIVHAVLRLPDPESARRAAEELHQSVIKGQVEGVPGDQDTKIDVLPNSLVSSKDDPKYGFTADSFTPHGSYILYDWAQLPAGDQDKDWAAKTIAKSVSMQGPLIDKFPATDPAKLKDLPIDIDGVLKYTVPPVDGKRTTSQQAVFGPRGMALTSSEPPTAAMKVFQDAGVEHVGVDLSNVYRAKDANAAVALQQEFGKEIVAQEFKESAAPKNVPGAKCYTGAGPTGDDYFYCLVVRDNLMGEISAPKEIDAQQATAAQFLIFQSAKK